MKDKHKYQKINSIKVIIEDTTGAVVQALADMTKDATGKYSYTG